ncbi:MAG TPA: aspartyl-tRNA amidotransferase [Dialister sp.]|nr:aspartyl-tRNA amidotransferase [Dialister sp.]
MSIKEQLMADMKAAMKAKEEGKLALNTIRMARAHIRQAEIDNGHADFNDDQVLAVLRKEVKQRKETLAEIDGSGREDLVKQTKAEIDVLEKYLPAEMAPEAVEAAVKEIVDAMDPGQRNMGSVMKAVMAKLKGQADGKLINQIVRKLLA